MQSNPVSIISSSVAESEHRSVVAANLSGTSTMRSGTIKVLEDECRDRVYAVVNAYRQHPHHKCILLRRRQAQLRRASKQQRANVHSGSCSSRRHKLCIQCHGSFYAGLEVLDGDFGHADKGGRVLHAACIHARTEDGDGRVVGGTEGFETLVALLAVVETGGHAVDAQVGRGDEFGGGPLACLFRVGGFDVAVD